MSLLTPNYASCALVVIDFQNDFVLPGAPLEIAGSYPLLPRLTELVRGFRAAGKPIVHVVRCYLPDGSNVDLCRRERVRTSEEAIIRPDSDGAMLPQPLLPENCPPFDWQLLLSGAPQPLGPQEWVLYKPRWGAFYQTCLESLLHAQGADTIIFAGCNYPNCPRTSIYEASERDFKLALAADALSGLYPQGAAELAAIGVEITDTESILARLKACSEETV